MYACRWLTIGKNAKANHDPAAVEFNEGHKLGTHTSGFAGTAVLTCDRRPPLEGPETKALAGLLLDSTRAAIPTAAADGLRTLPIAHVCLLCTVVLFPPPDSVGQGMPRLDCVRDSLFTKIAPTPE